MLKKIVKSKRGEGYVDMCVGVIVFVMILVIAINIFSFITLRIEMDQIADELLEVATYNGCFDTEFWSRDSDMLEDYYYYDVDYGADEYFNSTYHRVQLGHVKECQGVQRLQHCMSVCQEMMTLRARVIPLPIRKNTWKIMPVKMVLITFAILLTMVFRV